MNTVPEGLAAALADRYRLERELGAGGMATVYLAEDLKHHRPVAVKVLRPDLAASLGAERFLREVSIAARLNHPHILGLHDSGEADGFLYYVMPYVEGISLREKLAREGELPVSDVTRILRDVADALSYAHERGIVHRDIKPDNVMISSGHAQVTDFGVAKAVGDAQGAAASGLTSAGVALGTPTYMAPEQASGDLHVDHRADLYALGAMGYEMLAGRPPFSGMSAQAVLAAHVTQTPEPVTGLRPAIPAALGGLVMRCLEKRPADRWQTASELVPHLEALLTPSGGSVPTAASAAVSSGTEAALMRRHPVRVTVLSALGAAATLSLTWWLVQRLGLPDWVMPAAGVLLLVGLPIVLIAARQDRQRLVARTQGLTVTQPTSLAGRLMTLRGALAGSGLAFLGLAVGTGLFMALRAMGVGPFATLVTAGVLKERDRLVVADFANTTPDSTLGPSITAAFRIDLAQSSVIRLLEPDDIKGALTRMSREPATTVLTAELAREVAEREGARGVIAGEVGMLAGSYVLSVRLLAPDGTTLLAGREVASDAAGIIPALEKLSKKLREDVGESLRTLRAEPPLEQVTTASLDALRLYTQAERLADRGEHAESAQLLNQAVALDTGFAMAWRKLAVVENNMGDNPAKVLEASEKAYQMRDRLSRREAELAAASYFTYLNDTPRAIEAYERVLASWPDDKTARNNLGVDYHRSARFEDAIRVLRPPVDAGTDVVMFYSNLASAQLYLGAFAAAETTLTKYEARSPGNSERVWVSGDLAFAQERYDQAMSHYDSLAQAADLPYRVVGFQARAAMFLLRGRLREAERAAVAAMQGDESRGVDRASLAIPLRLAMVDVWVRHQTEDGVARVERALARRPLTSIAQLNRPYGLLVGFYATVGNTARARSLQAEYERAVPPQVRERDAEAKWGMGRLALAEQRYSDALRYFRAAHQLDVNGCRSCRAIDIGETFERAGQADSALATYEKVAILPGALLWEGSDFNLPIAYQRLGELYEAKGDKTKAVEYYGKFVDLWKDADPELQPRVAEIRKRMGSPR